MSKAAHTAGPQYYASIRGENRQGSLKWLSQCYCEIRDESGESNATFRPVEEYLCGTTQDIGHISFNGRVWNRPLYNGLSVPVCVDDSEMLFDSRTAIAAAKGGA
jgi:hypothetical protein